MELFRIIKNQGIVNYNYSSTQNKKQAEQVSLMITKAKPSVSYHPWHPYISASFKLKRPHPSARFRPPLGRHVFYGSSTEITALYEQAYFIMKDRVILQQGDNADTRTIFSVDADNKNAVHITDPHILDKNNYAASQQYITSNAHSFITYPSCRDPQHRINAAILDINHLAKTPNWESPIQFFYDDNLQQITWNNSFTITWQEVS